MKIDKVSDKTSNNTRLNSEYLSKTRTLLHLYNIPLELLQFYLVHYNIVLKNLFEFYMVMSICVT